MTLYLSMWSVIALAVYVLALALVIWVVTGKSAQAGRLNELAPNPDKFIHDDPEPVRGRAGWLPYWLAFGFLAGGVVRTLLVPPGPILLILLVAVAIGTLLGLLLSAILSQLYRSSGGQSATALTVVLAVGVGTGFMAGFTITNLGWLVLSVVIVATVTWMALGVRRPEASGYLAGS